MRLYRVYIQSILLAVCLLAGGQQTFSAPRTPRGPEPSGPQASADSLTVSFVTCFPGPEVYELCGHEAIRIRSNTMDSVWNYGMFDFTEPNFVYRFVKGQTDYRLGGYPFAWFLPEYVQADRRVVEQVLDLTQPEARRLLALLHEEEKPANSVYRYNYVKDNCATRPLARLDQAVGDLYIVYPDTLSHGTFRREMKAMHANYPWYQFGIDVALGSGLDGELKPRDEMFVPTVLMERMADARLSDGRKLVKHTVILNEGSTEAVLPPTPWWRGPVFWSWVLFGICLLTAFMDVRRKKLLRLVYSFYYILTGLAGLLVWFLVFFSEHEATSPNALFWWLTPIALIAGVGIWFGRCGGIVTAVSIWLETVGAALLLILWPVLPQSGNAAFFPLMGCAVALGAAYTIVVRENRLLKRGYHTSRTVKRVGGKTPMPKLRNRKK